MQPQTTEPKQPTQWINHLFTGKNLSKFGLLYAFAFGGLILLVYILSIEQLPDFTWNDLTGTLLAVCATAILAITLITIYGLISGYIARVALEHIYPEAAQQTKTKSNDPLASPKPYEQLIRAPFILRVTFFTFLFWTGIVAAASPTELISPYHTYLYASLLSALISTSILIIGNWEASTIKWTKILLTATSIGSASILSTIIIAWSADTGLIAKNPPPEPPSQSTSIDLSNYSLWAINHIFHIGISFTFLTILILIRKQFFTYVKFVTNELGKFIKWEEWVWPKWAIVLVSPRTQEKRANHRLIIAKICIVACFCLSSSLPFLTATWMANMGNTQDWIKSFFLIAVLLTVLNWGSFLATQWRQRLGLCLAAAALLFFSYPAMTQNASLLPKMTVTLLGLGNERLSTIGISSKQCATLAPFGADCSSNDSGGFTLRNVNLLNRLGSSVILELLLEDNSKTNMSSNPTTAIDSEAKLKNKDSLRALQVPATTNQVAPSPIANKDCDKLLLSKLQSIDSITEKTLRCVVLVVPKDQVFGYTKAGTRSYRGGYTIYQAAPADLPKQVRLIGS